MVQITIRDVPDEVKAELERLAARPSLEGWLERVRLRKQDARRRVPAREILRHRDADRR